MKKYLEELVALTGRVVKAEELGNLEQVVELRQAAHRHSVEPTATCEISFSERTSDRFDGFLKRLTAANPLPVYVWTPRTIDCGAFIAPSLAAINFGFDFAINDEGILSLTTTDLCDSLLLDFSVSASGDQRLKLERQGAHWFHVEY